MRHHGRHHRQVRQAQIPADIAHALDRLNQAAEAVTVKFHARLLQVSCYTAATLFTGQGADASRTAIGAGWVAEGVVD